ncbi:perforin-1-like [Pelodiscus sinensis]|uniref:perforin-1-like n=1 Tax=Pelodiscus sinensis TaxID=13735 RepID=UPI003F6C6966
MATARVFIPLLLLALVPGVSPFCRTGTAQECSKSVAFVPGHSLVREGIDVTTLGWTGNYLVDTSLWRGPNGTCTLCRNPLQGGQLQRAPLAVTDWKVNILCNRELSTSVQESAVAVARAMASDVNNDWKVELELPGESIGQALEGTRSELSGFAYEKEQQDKFMFVLHELPCGYYRMRVPPNPPLTPLFAQALSDLLPTYDPSTYRPFLATYGTHYVSQAVLGGRVRQLTAIPTCRAALDGLTDVEIKERLKSQFLQDLGLSQLPSGSHAQEPSSQSSWSSQAAYTDHRNEVTGGHGHANLLYSTKQDPGALSAWLESLKTSPNLISFSLSPIHTLVRPGDPQREALRQAVKEYVAERGQRRCPRRCPQGGYADPLEPCKCRCSGNPFTNSMCCSLQRGLARLKVHMMSGKDLWGDPLSPSDPYVKVIFQGQKLQTRYIKDNNNPQWFEDLDFGVVTLPVKPELEVEVRDSDPWPWVDSHLGTCHAHLKASRNVTQSCVVSPGLVTYSYSLECGPNLGGDTCQEYVPVRG